jgi:hypothetical protein
MAAINKKGFNDHPYIAGFKGERIELYAPNLAAAKQKAVEHFRPKKKDAGLLWVELASEE